LPFGQRLDQRHEDAEDALVRRHPGFLHPLQRGGRGGVAGEDHQIAALVPQPFVPAQVSAKMSSGVRTP
jgi:hypothetical protein